MKKLVFLMAVFLAVVVVAGCGKKSEQVEVAKNFWNALMDRDIERARSFATKESRGSLTLKDQDENAKVRVSFGGVEEKDGQAEVETTVHTENEGSSVDIPMQTVLIKEDGQWRVDVNLTMMSMFGGAMGAMMDNMKDSMEKMGKAMADGMEKVMKEE